MGSDPTLPFIPPHALGAQGDSTPAAVDPDDLDQYLVIGFKDLRRFKLRRADHLADVEQPLDPQVQFDKGAEIHHPRDSPLDQLPDLITIIHQGPGVGLQGLEAEGDPLPLFVHVKDVNVYLVPHLDDLAWGIDPAPTQL